MEEIPYPALYKVEERLAKLEVSTCKCSEGRLRASGSGTKADPLEILDGELEYADDTGGEVAWKPVITC
jgi:hypothetical protein